MELNRYAQREMKAIFSEENKINLWLDIEMAVLKAWETEGVIPEGTYKAIRSNAKVDIKRIKEIESVVHHEIIAFLTVLAENVGEKSRFIHLGLTSSDILDTATSLQIKEANNLIYQELEKLESVLKDLVIKTKDILCVGRTHGVHAEPITFGFKLAGYLLELKRNKERLQNVSKEAAVGKISGAVGTYAHLNPNIERLTLEQLGLRPLEVSTQIIPRDIFANVFSAWALIGAFIERLALEIRHLQKTEVLEMEEPFYEGQKGSSAMPHKRNPILCERLDGMSRILRGNLIVSLENTALWHERDISHSSVERMIIPESAILTHYMIKTMIKILTDCKIYPDNMMENLNFRGKLICSQRLLLELVRKNMLREQAYKIVQALAMKAFNEKMNFEQIVRSDPEIKSYLSEEELNGVFDYKYFVRYVDEIVSRVI
ncbi:adenylosuccinate lyase [Thermodesulfobium acidiphilum]|uniref:Adenylosuccinate lyase n=1 Tax=Thermodesulfobium acidiphilum TaxID=1794699 RepID=A0A2R4VY98_THEAF|nr:adenylosuccinate lyase [Thermodesulfobium acidiphilum]AWB09497.1 adenylosuccinate lyase [Thermodesulfobium acidiphilum]